VSGYDNQIRTYEALHLTPPDQPDECEKHETDGGTMVICELRRVIAKLDDLGMLAFADGLEELTDGYIGKRAPRPSEHCSHQRNRIRRICWKLGRLANGEDEG